MSTRRISAKGRWRYGPLLLAGCLCLVASAREVPITILQTTDIHGNLRPTRSYEGGEVRGGLLRCATLIRDIRRDARNVLLVDSGDLWVGSLESDLTRGQVVQKAVAWLGYDAWVPGNHDFDWGYERFRRLVAEAPMPVVAANISTLIGREAQAAAGIQPFIIREVDGVRVALIGLTTPGIPTWLLPEDIGPFAFERSIPALRRTLRQVRQEGADITLLLVHQGVKPFTDDEANELYRIATTFPELDLILGGHTHRAMTVDKLRREAPYLQAGYHAQTLGRADLVYDTVQRTLISVQLTMIPVELTLKPPAELVAKVREDLEATEQKAAEVVGCTELPIVCSYKAPGQCSGQQVLARAIGDATGAEIVFHGVLSEETIEAGPIRYGDIWRIVPYENRIGLLSLTPAEITDLLEQNSEYMDSPSFQGISGLCYDWDPNARSGARISNLRLPDGTKLHGRKRYRVAVNSYVLASGGLKFPQLVEYRRRPNARYRLTSVDTRLALLRYFKRFKSLRIPEGNEVRIAAPPGRRARRRK